MRPQAGGSAGCTREVIYFGVFLELRLWGRAATGLSRAPTVCGRAIMTLISTRPLSRVVLKVRPTGGGGWVGGYEDKKVCVPKIGLSLWALYSKLHFSPEKIFWYLGLWVVWLGGGGSARSPPLRGSAHPCPCPAGWMNSTVREMFATEHIQVWHLDLESCCPSSPCTLTLLDWRWLVYAAAVPHFRAEYTILTDGRDVSFREEPFSFMDRLRGQYDLFFGSEYMPVSELGEIELPYKNCYDGWASGTSPFAYNAGVCHRGAVGREGGAGWQTCLATR